MRLATPPSALGFPRRPGRITALTPAVLRLITIALALCLGCGWVHAQSPRVPPKDVAILVDISKSVLASHKRPLAEREESIARYNEVRELIIKLITGESIDWNNSAWAAQPSQDTAMLALFGRALGVSESATAVPPLTTPGHNLLLQRIGTFHTVMNYSSRSTISSLDQLASSVRRDYPRESDVQDNSTCFWFAMARAASLRDLSREGYYLFVVSDEQDDPDYPKDRATHEQITNRINEHFERIPESSGKDAAYRPKLDFPMTLIAKIYQRKFPDDASKLSLQWYAMGPVPTPTAEPRPAAINEPSLIPPKFKREIVLLGGLEAFGNKTFHYVNPLLVWQIPYGDIDGSNNERFVVQTNQGRDVPLLRNPPSDTGTSLRVDGPKTTQLMLEGGKYTVKVVHLGEGNNGRFESKPVTIQIDPWNEWWLPSWAIISGLLALAAFIYNWRSVTPRPAS